MEVLGEELQYNRQLCDDLELSGLENEQIIPYFLL